MKNEFIQDGEIGINFLAMFEFTIPAGARMPLPHKHEQVAETTVRFPQSDLRPISGSIRLLEEENSLNWKEKLTTGVGPAVSSVS